MRFYKWSRSDANSLGWDTNRNDRSTLDWKRLEWIGIVCSLSDGNALDVTARERIAAECIGYDASGKYMKSSGTERMAQDVIGSVGLLIGSD